MTSLGRRDFLKRTGALSLGFLGASSMPGNAPPAFGKSDVEGFGALVPDPNGLMNLRRRRVLV